MKKQLLGIAVILLGLFSSGSLFAAYDDCSQNKDGSFYCQEYQSCNNPGGFCVCSKNGLVISHNTTCFVNRPNLIRTRVVSSYATSGSVVSFLFTIKNTAGDKYFFLKLPESYNTATIKITNLDMNNLVNGSLLSLMNGKLDPQYLIKGGETRTISITGEIVSSALGFDTVVVTPYMTSTNASSILDSIPTFIYPIANYSIEQKILDPKPLFSGETINYEVKISNIGSAVSPAVSLTSMLGSFLGNPILKYQGSPVAFQAQNDQKYTWNNLIGSLNPGETKIVYIEAPLTTTPFAGKTITTTGTIVSGRELTSLDNTAVTTYTIPTNIDLIIDKIEKTTLDPEASGDILGFSITYNNKGNTGAQNISLTTVISGTTNTISSIQLPNLEGQTTNTVELTGLVNQNYPLGTKFCLSGNISASNETATENNNSFSGACYTFVKSADITVKADLTNTLTTIASGSILSYNITLSNKGEKTATGVSLLLTPSANQTSQTSVFLSGITLLGGEEKTIAYTAILNAYPIQGSAISLTGEAVFGGKELDKTNNTFAANYNLPGLSDVYLTHTMLPFSGFKIGDKVTFIIQYGNSGYAAANNPIVKINLPSAVTVSQTEWNLGNTLASNANGTIVITGTLNQFLAAGTAFSSEAVISTTSAQVTTTNDKSTITSTISSFDNISFDLSAQNTTRPALTANPQTLVRGVYDDIITFTVTYTNNGNVPANNVTVSFSNLGSLSLDPFNANIGTIGVNQQGSINIKGRINSKNFATFSPIATISYNSTGVSDRITIEEPYSCGDGLVTRDEVCDSNGQINVATGQACENQQGQCVLVTKYIANTACVEFNGTSVCSNPAIINLKGAVCGSLEVDNGDNSSSVTARCIGQYTNAFTPVSINCGNGNIFTGLAGNGGMFAANCSYGSIDTANNARISCSVGTDTNNPACKRGVASCDLDLETKVVILDSDDEEGSVEVECSTKNGQEASLQIDCGNGKTSKIEKDNVFDYTCTYDEDDFSNHDITKNIECRVNGATACEQEVILDQGFVGICGNGVREGYEQCDGGGTKGEGNRKGEDCKRGCTLNEPAGSCLSVGNGNISVQNNEFMPFWWKISNTKNISNTNKCNESNKDTIRASGMKCSFSLQQPGKDAKEIFEIPCDEKQLSSVSLFNNFYPEYWRSAFGNYFIDLKQLNSSRKFNENILGEHKIRLDKVDYEYCACDGNDCEWKDSELQNVCETNFTVTKPYLVQKSAFGITPKATNIDLKSFYDMNGDPLVNKTDLSNVMILDESSYAGSSLVNPMMDNFIYRMEKLSVKVPTANLPKTLKDAGVTAKKVPNKDIYILEGKSAITLKPGASFSKPFTIIVKNTTLIIEGDLDVNGMFIVKGGTIKFNEKNGSDCTKPQTVKGIFVATNFDANKITNDNLNKTWCNAGGLYVKGVLIGNGIKNLVTQKRASLPSWFRVNGSEKTIQVQRRNQIFNGASVLIEYSPELWQQLPPGADEFTKALEIYKK